MTDLREFRRPSSVQFGNDPVRSASGRPGGTRVDTLPLAVWCRPAALLVLEERQRYERKVEAYRWQMKRGRNAADLTRSG
jgi:hypothetical protein